MLSKELRELEDDYVAATKRILENLIDRQKNPLDHQVRGSLKSAVGLLEQISVRMKDIADIIQRKEHADSR